MGSVGYQRHRPEQTLLYQIVERHYPAFVEHLAVAGKQLLPAAQAGAEMDLDDHLRGIDANLRERQYSGQPQQPVSRHELETRSLPP